MKTDNSIAAERRHLYREMAPLNLTPLWEVLHQLVPLEPHTPCRSALWRYDEIRPFLARAGLAITAEEAVRRVLILENPALRGQSAITQSLYAGLQLILPGEIAPAHRHTQSALRFVVEGQGAYTTVDGERSTMHPGDFIITPSWTWHDHGCSGKEPVVWLDGLDIPMVRFFDAGFAENASIKAQQPTKVEGASYAKFGHNMAPMRISAQTNSPFGLTSPIFSYPYAESDKALGEMAATTEVDAWDGYKLRFLNPLTGASPMPTMGTYMQRLPAGFAGKPYRQTDGTVFSVVAGEGIAALDFAGQSQTISFKAKDLFVVPSWHCVRFSSTAGCTLFSYSDRPVQKALGIFKEERLA
jgi:gentisate 1,2-dioxygenase